MEFSVVLLDAKRGKNRKILKIIEVIVKEVMMKSQKLTLSYPGGGAIMPPLEL